MTDILGVPVQDSEILHCEWLLQEAGIGRGPASLNLDKAATFLTKGITLKEVQRKAPFC